MKAGLPGSPEFVMAFDMSTHDQLLAEIDRFLALSGMSPTRLGKEALGDVNVIFRLRKGLDVSTRRADALMAYMRDWRPEVPRPTMRAGTTDSRPAA